MTAAILSFGRRKPNSVPLPSKMPWQNQDLAELYRVRDRLCAAGLEVEVEGGVTDEGDPWFVYQQAGTDNVVVHIARIDDEIHVINCVTGGTYRGQSFREVSDQMLEDAPLALGAQLRRSSNVVLHPSAFLTAFVAAAIMLVDLLEHGRAEAAETHNGHSPGHDGAHDSWFAARVSHAVPDEPASHGKNEDALEHDAVDDAGALLHRRLGKEGATGGAGTAPANGNATAPSMPLSTTATGGHGFMAELPSSGASFALTAGMFAAELLRVIANEDSGIHAEPSFASEFTALLTSFVSNDAIASERSSSVPSMATASNFALLSGASNIVTSDPALSTRIVALNSSGDSLSHAFSVKAAVEPMAETSGLLSLDSHKVAAPIEKVASTPAMVAPVALPGTPTASVEAPTPTSHATEAVQNAATPSSSANPPATASIASSVVPAATASVATPAKDAATDAVDLNWVVSQLVKRGSVAIDAALKIAAISNAEVAGKDAKILKAVSAEGSAGDKVPAVLQDSASKTDGKSHDTAAGVSDKIGNEASSKLADIADLKIDKVATALIPTAIDKAESILEGGAGKVAEPSKPPAFIALHIESDGSLGRLIAGRAETVHYVAGSNLTIEGFVFGEDILSFIGDAGDRISAIAHQDGTDLVLGETGIGLVRLVGVLADPLVLAHQNATTS